MFGFFLYGGIVASTLVAGLGAALFRLTGIPSTSTLGFFAIVAPVEETLKILGPLLLLSWTKADRNEPYEWFMAAAASGAGFGAAENLVYFAGSSGSVAAMLFVGRGVALLHLAWTATVGFLFASGIRSFPTAASLPGNCMAEGRWK